MIFLICKVNILFIKVYKVIIIAKMNSVRGMFIQTYPKHKGIVTYTLHSVYVYIIYKCISFGDEFVNLTINLVWKICVKWLLSTLKM